MIRRCRRPGRGPGRRGRRDHGRRHGRPPAPPPGAASRCCSASWTTRCSRQRRPTVPSPASSSSTRRSSATTSSGPASPAGKPGQADGLRPTRPTTGRQDRRHRGAGRHARHPGAASRSRGHARLGRRRHGPEGPDQHGADLQDFAFAAAIRYRRAPQSTPATGQVLPAVTRWEAWNEPNTAIHLIAAVDDGEARDPLPGQDVEHDARLPAHLHRDPERDLPRRALGRERRRRSPRQVAGGATKPNGNGPCDVRARRRRRCASCASWPSATPSSTCTPITRTGPAARSKPCPLREPRRRRLRDLGSLIKALDAAFPGKHLHLWITEYGVQTNPPDRYLGVSLGPAGDLQLRRNVTAARANSAHRHVRVVPHQRRGHPRKPFAAGFQTGLAHRDGRQEAVVVGVPSLAR